MKASSYLFGLVLCLVSAISAAQKPVQAYIEEGNTALEQGNPYLAERIFEKAATTYPNNLAAQYLFGKTLLTINEYYSAAEVLEQALYLDEKDSLPDIIHQLARAKKSAGLLGEALDTYSDIYTLTASDPKSPQHKRAAKEISTIKRILDGDFDGLETQFENLDGINTDESDFAPSYADQNNITFSRSAGVFNYLENISIAQYQAQRKKDDWKKPKALPAIINKSGNLSANGVFTKDSSAFFYTLCNGATDCGIYRIPVEDGDFGTPRPVSLFKTKTFVTHPFPFETSTGQKGLLFTARHDSGFGGLDIYVAYHNGENYANPRNLGPFVNSPEDDITPFYVPEKNVLFFSSSWNGGLGEKDIFYTYTPDLVRFSQLVNLKKPFVSPANDTYFKLNDSLNSGLLVSNREGGKKNRYRTCCNDIYEFDYPFDSLHSDYETLMAQLMDTVSYRKVEDDNNLMARVNQLVDSLRNLLPLPLYFHNDEPNPRTTQRTTSKTYKDALTSYLSKRTEYQEINPNPEVDAFFDSTLLYSFQRFNTFLNTLEKLYSITPYPIVMAVRGYASPLAESNYNTFLSERRISSVQNYFYQQGFDTEANTVDWVINPYGENTAASSVSDDYSDQKNSVYSLGAMLERRVEIQWLQLDKSRILKDTIDQETADSSKIESLFYPLGRIQTNTTKKAVIALYNPYKTPLSIAEIRNSCNCTEVHLETYDIAPGKSIPVELEILGSDKPGEYSLELMIYPASEDQKPIRVLLGLEAEK